MRLSYRSITAALCFVATALPAALANEAVTGMDDKVQAQSLLQELIPFRTAKGYGRVPAMIDHLAAVLRDAGFSAQDIVRVPLKIDGENVSGLIVRFPARSVSSTPPVLFLAHMDVVDALPENWDTDPFVPQVIDGYLYGRGSQDNKFGVALLVSTFANLKAAGFEPDRDLVLAFSGDEETGMLTTREILKHPYVRDAEYALNSDAGGGTMMRDGKATGFSMQTAEKQYATFALTTTNPGGHSSVPQPENSIYDLARALTSVETLRFPVQFNDTTRSMAESVAKREGGAIGTALTTLLRDPTNKAAISVMEQYPQYANMLWTTCVATMLAAGHAENALPQNARGTVNCRILPDTGGVDDVRGKLTETIENEAVKIELIGESVPSPSSPIREDVLAILQAGVAVNYPGVALQPTMSSGGTEGREYRRAGIPTYGAGSLAIVRPDDSRAHGTNERIPLQSLSKETTYWDYVIRRIGAGKDH
jgi:acetylornithine deacetylase/succinyl-diaminopimelate desuccinylase-like protein